MRFFKIFTVIAYLSSTLAVPLLPSHESYLTKRDETGAVTSTAGLAWYDPVLTDGTAGRGANASAYTCYSGPASSFPAMSTWINFESMWSLQVSDALTPIGDSPAEQTSILNGITNISVAAKVDARVVLAVVILESTGNVRVNCTTSYGSVRNCGIMQSYNGSSYNSSQMQASITQMVHDGVQGTTYGPGLVQYFNDANDTAKETKGNVYAVFRSYNSGKVNASDLSDGEGASAAYVSNLANYLQGWNGSGKGPANCSFMTSTTTPTTPTATATCASSAHIAAPTSTVAGTTPDCCKWVTVASGSTCDTIDVVANITFAQFRSWNTYIDASCDNLWAGYAYCVSGNLPASSTSSSSSPTVKATSTSTTSKFSSTTISTTSETSSKASTTSASSAKASTTSLVATKISSTSSKPSTSTGTNKSSLTRSTSTKSSTSATSKVSTTTTSSKAVSSITTATSKASSTTSVKSSSASTKAFAAASTV